MPCVMKIICRADGSHLRPDPTYLQSMDFEADYTRGRLSTTRKIEEAMIFTDKTEAFKFWKTTSKDLPKRPDGKPNRPLTAYSVEIVDVGQIQ